MRRSDVAAFGPDRPACIARPIRSAVPPSRAKPGARVFSPDQLDRMVHGAGAGHGQDRPAPAGLAAIVRRAVGRRARRVGARPRGVLLSHTPADLGTLAMVVITLARRLCGGRRGGRARRVGGGRRDGRGLRLFLTGAQHQEEDRNGGASHKARRSRSDVHVGVPSKGRAPRGRHARVRGELSYLGSSTGLILAAHVPRSPQRMSQPRFCALTSIKGRVRAPVRRAYTPPRPGRPAVSRRRRRWACSRRRRVGAPTGAVTVGPGRRL